MTAVLSIPARGEDVYLGSEVNAAVPRAYRYLAGALSTAGLNDLVITTAATYELVNVPANFVVMEVLSRVITAFTGSVTLTIGDGDSAAGYLASADIAPQTAVTTGIYVNATAGGEAYAKGKKYAAADTIDIVLAAATAAVGQVEIIIIGFQL